MSDFVLELPGSIAITNPLPLFKYYNNKGTPYLSTTEACVAVPRAIRHAGLTVLVGDVEYWWLVGNLSDTGLVVKTASSSGGGGIGQGTIVKDWTLVKQDMAGGTVMGGRVYEITNYPASTKPIYVMAVDSNLFAPKGYIYDAGTSNTIQVNVNVGAGTFSYEVVVNGEGTFAQDFTVSQSGGRTFGHYQDGDIVNATGKTAREVILMAAIDQKFPQYLPAGESIAQTANADGEVGEPITNVLTGYFSPNDAGGLIAMRVLRNNVAIGPNSNTTPVTATDTTVRVLGSITYQVSSDYSAGVLKKIMPDNIDDTRPAQVRNPYAPQAAENNFISGPINLNGYYRYFFGPVVSAPTTSGQVRALANAPLSNAGNVLILNTGNTQKSFAMAIPQNRSILSVVDLDALNADITSQYVAQSFNVQDAGGNAVPYKIYTMTQAVPYSNNHRHQITLG